MSSDTHRPDRDMFRLYAPSGSFSASGIQSELSRGDVSTLASRVGAFFATQERGPERLVGAIPFDLRRKDASPPRCPPGRSRFTAMAGFPGTTRVELR
jgi:isochorismate synthase